MKNIDEEVIEFLKKNHSKAILLSKNIKKTYYIHIQCECGYIWKTKWKNIKIGKWCKKCHPEKFEKVTIEKVKQFVKEKYNGECLDNDYKNTRSLLNFKCEKNHYWKACWSNINSGFWCPFCNTPKPTIEKINSFINGKGICLNLKYIRNDKKLKFKCNCGNVFEETWNNIRNGIWCKERGCSKRFVPTIDYIKKFVWGNYQSHCLEETYVNSETFMLFKCKNGHITKMKWQNIKSGNWCPDCSKTKRKNIEEVNLILKEKYNGRCLDKEYKNNKSPLRFECSKKHQWISNWHNVNNHWCPVCTTKFGEKFTKFIFEKTFGYSFYKIRPDWLINPKTGKKLELDGYCSDLNLAFEYNGKQHYELHDKFHNNVSEFTDQKYRDNIKKKICLEKNVELIIIPQFNRKFKPEHLKDFILKSIKKEYKINEEFNISEFWAI